MRVDLVTLGVVVLLQIVMLGVAFRPMMVDMLQARGIIREKAYEPGPRPD